MMNVYVVWRQDRDDYVVTRLLFDDTDAQRQAIRDWSTDDYIEQAFGEEYPGADYQNEPYDCIAIFEAANVRFIL